MTPRPEVYDETIFSDMDMYVFDMMRGDGIMDHLIRAKMEVQEVPRQKVIAEKIGFRVSKAVLVRGSSLYNLIQLTARHHLMPQHSNDKEKFKFWRDNFDINIQLNQETQRLTVSRLANPTSLSWENHFFGFESGYLTDASANAIIALAVIPDSVWGDIAKTGLVVGGLRGDVYDAPWRADARSVLLPNKNNILINPHEGTIITDYLVSHDQDWLEETFFGHSGDKTNLRRIAYVEKTPVVGVFSDMRTMK